MSRVPQSAPLIAEITGTLPDGDDISIRRYRSHTRATRTDWVVHARYRGRRRTWINVQQYTGGNVDRADAEWAESIQLVRDAGAANLQVKDYPHRAQRAMTNIA